MTPDQAVALAFADDALVQADGAAVVRRVA